MLLNRTPVTFDQGSSATNDYAVTIPATAAGSFLVVVATAGAVVTCFLGGIGGTAFATKRATSLGNVELSCSETTDVTGGTTSIGIHLSAQNQNVGVTVYEFSTALTFATSVTSNSYVTQSSTTLKATGAASSTLGANAVAVLAAVVDNSTAAGARCHGLSPSGKVWHRGTAQSGTGRQFYYAHGTADVTSASQSPYNNSAGTYSTEATFGTSGLGVYLAAWYYTDTSGQPTKVTGTATLPPVAVENSGSGVYRTSHQVSTTQLPGTISGYTDRVSVAPGQTINFKAHSGGSAHTLRILRMGHYGTDVHGAREYATPTCTPASQPSPTVDSALGSTSCAWTTTASWTVPADAAPGVYSAIFTLGANSYATIFVVRPVKPTKGRIAVLLPMWTYRGYCQWGDPANTTTMTGKDYYGGNGTQVITDRAFAVSADKPFGTLISKKETWFYDSDYAMIQFLEAMGYDLEYFADSDLGSDPNLLTNAGGIIMVGHHEYYSLAMRQCLNNAITAGVNVFIHGANNLHWKVRFDSDTDPHLMYCYKDSYQQVGHNGTVMNDPTGFTGIWRDARTSNPANPDRRPEMPDLGLYFGVSGPCSQALSIPYALKGTPPLRNSPAVQALTVGQTWTSAKNLIGYEADVVGTDPAQPTNLAYISQTSFSSTTNASSNGPPYNGSSTVTHRMVMYQHPSGSMIFNAGTWRLSWALGRWSNQIYNAADVPSLDMQNLVVCALADMGMRPTTLRVMEPGTDSTAPSDPGAAQPASAYGLTAAGASCGPIRIR